MPYSVVVNGEGENLRVDLLGNEGVAAEVFAFGAILNKFSIVKDEKEINVIDAYSNTEDAKNNITNGFHGAKLSPFVCRLANSAFSFEGKEYQIDKFKDGASALHGLMFDEVFELEDKISSDDFAIAVFSKKYDTDVNGFPFPFTLKVKYKLEGKSLTIDTFFKNEGDSDIPFNDGWHPYFQLGDSVDTLEGRFKSKELAVFDDTLLPTGEFVPYSEFADFRTFEGVELDNSFTLIENDEPAIELRDKQVGIELKVFPDKGYPILQLYIPPSRKSLAVENLTSIPNSFNHGIGLLIAKPGKEYQLSTKYTLELI
ncbi:aldose 1-epimerase [Rhizosphaericola mali]|uniref:Aldose 1-epimerase n=1 Tax=Rhizosphaericola mali TaxID=2545455 RepID=A0A5P2G8I3_9BACT|nr:aldose 1-epimerase [Rhizosphaericola mali]QES90609.1 aldose 1-epimerase [Rhizosphaericola mali]